MVRRVGRRPASAAGPPGSPDALGPAIFGAWVLPFEVTVLLLTVAAAGTIALAFFRRGLAGRDEIEIEGIDDPARPREAVLAALARPTPERIRVIAQAFRLGLSTKEIRAACQQMGGERMAQSVGRYFFIDAGSQGVTPNDLPESLAAERFAGAIDE